MKDWLADLDGSDHSEAIRALAECQEERDAALAEVKRLTEAMAKRDEVREHVRELLEGVLLQVGDTHLGAFDDVEAFLGVEWSASRQCFLYPDGRSIGETKP